MPLDNSKLIWLQLSSFIGAGAIATLCDYSVFFILLHILNFDHVLSALSGYVIGGIVSYMLSRTFVFSSSRRHRSAISRFASVMAIGFALTGISMMILVDYLSVPALLGRILTYGIVLAFNFCAHRFFTFDH